MAAHGEEAGVELALGREPRAGAVAAERLRDRGDDADLAGAVLVAASAWRPRRGTARRPARRRTPCRAIATISAAGTTSSMRQPFVAPTSMYSMKRSVSPVLAEVAARAGRSGCSLTPRLTTQLTLTGSPTACAASMPSSTRATGKSTSFIALKIASSSESRLTVMRFRPASLSACAFCGQQRRRWSSASGRPASAASIAISRSMSRAAAARRR